MFALIFVVYTVIGGPTPPPLQLMTVGNFPNKQACISALLNYNTDTDWRDLRANIGAELRLGLICLPVGQAQNP